MRIILGFFLFLLISTPTWALDFTAYVSSGVYKSDQEERSYSMIDDEFSTNEATSALLRAIANVEENWSIHFQLLFLGRDRFDIQIDQAYITWLVSENFRIDLGRQRTPIWLASEIYYKEIDFVWTRLPLVVYNPNPLNTFTGGNIRYSFACFSLNCSFEIFGGQEDKTTQNGEFEIEYSARDVLGSTFNVASENFRFRAGYFQTNTDNAAFKIKQDVTVGPSTAEFENQYDINLMQTRHFASGFSYDNRRLHIASEYGRTETDNEDFEIYWGFYNTLGYYFFNEVFLPHFTYGRGGSELSVSKGLISTYNLAGNIYFNKDVVLKLGWLHIETDHGSYGFDFDAINTQAVFTGLLPNEPDAELKADILQVLISASF